MAISIISSSIGTATGATSCTATAPATIADLDILIGYVFTNAANATISWPAGFAEWGNSGALSGSNYFVHIGWKRASSESGNYTWTGTTRHWDIMMMAVRGCKTSGDPANVAISNTQYVTNDTILRAAGITPTTEVALIFGGSKNGSAVSSTPPSGFTWKERCYENYDSRIGYKLSVSAGATGNVDGAISPAGVVKHAMMVALEPAGAAAVFCPQVIMI